MANAPFLRGTSKVGRNDKCPCGSGKKFKQCHGGVENTLPALLARDRLEKEIIAQGKRHFEREKTKELQRQKQQGLGRPIISTEYKGYRFVAVAGKVHYGKWRSFSDFLTNYIKATIGSEWGNAEIAKPFEDRHPLMQWYDKLCRLQLAHVGSPGEMFSTPETGAVSAYYRLAYNLYLIAHNGKDIQTRLLARLRNEDNFQGAYYETQVAAWLIKAGFELEFEDEQDTSSTHCEFTATYISTGDKYSVEAKSHATSASGNMRTAVGRKLRQALAKRALHKRLVFLDLNKPLHSREAADFAFDHAEEMLRRVEPIDIDGMPAPAAYVCLTNMNDQHALDSSSLATMIGFRGFKIDDFMGAEFPTIIAAVRARERHWPMVQLFKSIEEHREIPQTFGGELPSEVFPVNPLPRIRIGDMHLVPGPDGHEVPARITSACVMDGKAYSACHDPQTDKGFVVTMPLTPEELADYEKYPDTFFGEYQRQSRGVETPIELFDFFFESYQHTPKERLLEFLKGRPNLAALRNLAQKDLAEIYCEGMVYSAVQKGFGAKSPRPRRRHPYGPPPDPSDTPADQLPPSS